MMSVSLRSATSGFSDQTVSLHETSQSANYETLERALGLNEKQKAVVVNDEGAALKFLPGEVQDGASFVVVDRSDLEMDVANSKWTSGEQTEEFKALIEKYSTSRERNAAANAVAKTHTVEEGLLFPDYNRNLRDAFVSGTRAQMTPELTKKSTDTDRVAGLPHEPTLGELANFQVEQLRAAFILGLNNSDKRPEHMPTALQLREAHRRGKEAVCIRIGEADWGRVDINTFKLCAVPTEYAVYEGGVEKKEIANADKRAVLRTFFIAGVEDAWRAREKGAVTQVKSSDRVPENPSIQDAFMRGVQNSKMLSSSVPGATYEVTPDGEVRVNGESDARYKNERTAFEKGLALAWQANSGAELPRADSLYPDTTNEEVAAFRSGLAVRRKMDKDKEERLRNEEIEKEEARKEAEKPTFIDHLLYPCIQCKNACWPMCTEDADSRTLVCGTTIGDWTLIICLFIFYYLYLAMWFWAFIEIMMVIAEPQRPH